MRAMIELALRESDGGLISAREIAASQQIPLRFLEQQLGTLNKAGLVESHRGAGGGCHLAKPASKIYMSDIADAIEGAFYPMGCLEPGDHTCFADEHCGLQELWGDVYRAIRQVFEETSISTLADRHRKLATSTPVFSPSELIRPR